MPYSDKKSECICQRSNKFNVFFSMQLNSCFYLARPIKSCDDFILYQRN